MKQMKSSLRLYRGIKADDFVFDGPAAAKRHDSLWREILEHRQESGRYPSHLNAEIIRLHGETRLRHQAFSDQRETAERYLSRQGGLLVELEVPLDDILRYFELEIQNYAKRKRSFEIVYTVRSSVLARHAETWRCRIIRLKPT